MPKKKKDDKVMEKKKFKAYRFYSMQHFSSHVCVAFIKHHRSLQYFIALSATINKTKLSSAVEFIIDCSAILL